MLETISGIVFILIAVIAVAIFLPQYFPWVVGAIVATLLFNLLDKNKTRTIAVRVIVFQSPLIFGGTLRPVTRK
jgi:hypothetical protein